jgi:competence protein ComEC
MSDNQSIFKFENIMRQIFRRDTVDIAFITHDDADHAGAVVELSRNERIGAYGLSQFRYTYIDKVFRKIKAKNDNPIKLDFLMKGVDINFGHGSSLNVLYPIFPKTSALKFNVNDRSSNSESLVMKYNFEHTSVLFTGDIGFKEEAQLLSDQELYNNDYLRSDILKIGHHGSKGSTDPKFLEYVNPNFAFISAGFKNRYGHPHVSVLKRLGKNNQVLAHNIYRTDICGTVKFYLYKNGAVGRRDCNSIK